ncbi:MAG: Gfo/Idh/MocA family oxidoreductase, partial [Devosia sp.]|nr:Gfo/Idh/MocA family oxidoreductase [Devosia sp.]
MSIRIAAIGLTHSHIYGQVDCLLREGATLVGFWSDEEDVATPFGEKYPQARRVADRRELLDDPSIHMILTSAIPAERAEIAIASMRAGKDVMTDKPGMTSLVQLA